MILPITENIRIASDRYQWTIQERLVRKRKGKTVVEWIGRTHYPTFEMAVRELGEGMVRESDAVGFIQALADVENVCAALCKALPSHITVTSETGEFPERGRA